MGSGAGSTEQPTPSDHSSAACLTPGLYDSAPDCEEPCFPRLNHDLAHDFPRRGLVSSQWKSDHNLETVSLTSPWSHCPAGVVLPSSCSAGVCLPCTFKSRQFIA